ncbi:MAG TPA: hypothetical protein IAC47_07970 [Candidatus Onthomorpha intestinigallinarum]|uniref:Uncharacterized protein n=1 Tax=Candidatus Onthomorpha intestinigallinarum TaxID=2840880 RepID=A0A9D1UHL8_9BACT|nr:hypothetical protein [Candidatus Onthomorpha intestinigallinarum]
MIDKKTNNKLSKVLTGKERKASWWSRNRRKKLTNDIVKVLTEFEVRSAWAHKAFVSAQEKRPKNITVYVEFAKATEEGFANKVDMAMDKAFPRKKINVIDVKSLLPSVKEFAFRDVDKIL